MNGGGGGMAQVPGNKCTHPKTRLVGPTKLTGQGARPEGVTHIGKPTPEKALAELTNGDRLPRFRKALGEYLASAFVKIGRRVRRKRWKAFGERLPRILSVETRVLPTFEGVWRTFDKALLPVYIFIYLLLFRFFIFFSGDW